MTNRLLQRAKSSVAPGLSAALSQPRPSDTALGGQSEPISPTTQDENAPLRTDANAPQGRAAEARGGEPNGFPRNPQPCPQPTAVEPIVYLRDTATFDWSDF